MLKLWQNQTVRHFMKLYLLVFLCMTIVLSATLAVFVNRIFRDTLSISALQAEESMKRLDNEIERMIFMINVFYTQPDYRIIEAGENYKKTQYTYQLRQVIGDFTTQVRQIGIAKDMALIMKGNTVLCKDQFHSSISDFYGKFIYEEGYETYESWLESMKGSSGLYSYRVSDFRNLAGEYEAIAMIIPLSSNSKGKGTVLFATFDKTELVSLLALENLTEGLQINIDENGQTLCLDEKRISREEARIHVKGRYGISLSANIDSGTVASTMSDMFRVIAVILSAYLFIGVILAVYFIRRSAVPLVRIMDNCEKPFDSAQTEEEVHRFQDGYDNLRNFIGTMSEKYYANQKLILQQKEILAHSRLEHALCDPLGSGSYEELLRYYPDFPMPWRMVLFKICGQEALSVDEMTMLQNYITEAVGKDGENGAVMHFFENMLILFVPEHAGEEKYKETVERIKNVLPKDVFGSRHIAVSSVYKRFEMIHTVFSRLRFILETGDEDASAMYVETEPMDEKEEILAPDKQNWNRFSALIMRNQLDDALALLMQDVRSAIYANSTGSELIQLYYLYRSALLSVAATLTVPCPVSVPQYSANADIVACFDDLCDAARKVHEAMREQVVASREISSIETDVIRYLDENYLSADICVLSVTEEFKIPEAQLQKIIRMYTGKSFHAYIEGKRMEHAAYLLTETDAPVSKILQECGYFTTSTFYRAFKMYYGDTPSVYREKFNNAKDEKAADSE